jgi:RNA polymerase sigma-70 factor (ECF subfamily)
MTLTRANREPTHHDADEAELIRRSGAGDTESFGRLVEMHQGRVRAYVGSYLHWPDLVDDIAQEVFLAAYADLRSYRGDSAFSTWLLGIARHRVLRQFRGELRKSRAIDELLDRGRVVRLEEDGERLGERERAIAALQRCLESLPPGSSEIVAEHYFRASSLADMARKANKGESALRMALLRIRRALRECMERRLAMQAPAEGQS